MTNKDIADRFTWGATKGTANSMFIEEKNGYTVIYSYGYHFPIAILKSETGKAFFNSDGYSNTTARHKGHVRRSLEARGVEITYKTTEELQKIANGGITEEEKGLKQLKTVATVAMLGDIFGSNQKEKNDWKTRMLKAGLPEGALLMPEDWETLSEDDKEARLNGAIQQLK